MAKGITMVTTSEDKGITTTIKGTDPKLTSKEMWLPPEIPQTPVSNAERRDTTPETALNVA